MTRDNIKSHEKEGLHHFSEKHIFDYPPLPSFLRVKMVAKIASWHRYYVHSDVQLEIQTSIITNDESFTANESRLYATIKTRLALTYFQAQLKGKPTCIFLVFLFQWEFSKQFLVVFRCGGTSDMKYFLLLFPWGFVVRYILSPSSPVNMSKNFLLRVPPFDVNTCTLSPIL